MNHETPPPPRPFLLERYFGRWEHAVPHQLSASDCEPLRLQQLLDRTDTPVEDLLAVRLHYTETRGGASLRAAIAEHYPGCSADDVLVVNAPQEAIHLHLHSVLRPGDRVVVLTPCYQSLKDLPVRRGCRVDEWRLRTSASGFALDWPALEQLLQQPAALLITNFPHNPTGVMPTPGEWLRLGELVADNGCRWFSDEIYRGLEPAPERALPPAASVTARATSLWGLSKSFGLPGLRLGFLVSRDADLLRRIEQQKDWTSICANALSEFLAERALRAGSAILADHRALIAANRQRMLQFAARHPAHLQWQPPAAGPVSMAQVAGGTATAMAERVRGHGALLVPSDLFDLPDTWVRIGLGRQDFDAALRCWAAAL